MERSAGLFRCLRPGGWPLTRPGQWITFVPVARYFIIFGAAVLPGGTPSGTLRRRIAGALDAASGDPAARFLVTGGLGRHEPSEADVMADALRDAGVDPARILIEDQAGDTLDSALLSARMLALRGDVELLSICTSRYHQPRCALLMRMLGFRVTCPPMPADRPSLGTVKWLRYIAKEVLATPYDAMLLSLRLIREKHS